MNSGQFAGNDFAIVFLKIIFMNLIADFPAPYILCSKNESDFVIEIIYYFVPIIILVIYYFKEKLPSFLFQNTLITKIIFSTSVLLILLNVFLDYSFVNDIANEIFLILFICQILYYFFIFFSLDTEGLKKIFKNTLIIFYSIHIIVVPIYFLFTEKSHKPSKVVLEKDINNNKYFVISNVVGASYEFEEYTTIKILSYLPIVEQKVNKFIYSRKTENENIVLTQDGNMLYLQIVIGNNNWVKKEVLVEKL